MNTLRRARTLQEMRDCLSLFLSVEGMERALAFRPRPTDVVISPFAQANEVVSSTLGFEL